MERGGFLTQGDREALDRFPPEVDVDDLRRCFWLGDNDRQNVVDRRYGPAARLAGGLQLGALRLLGFVPADLTTSPIEVVAYVAAQVDATAADLARYTTRVKTRYEHSDAVASALGFRRCDQGDLKALGDWLVERAMEHDRPMLLFRLACDHLRSEQILRPGVTTVERAVIAARHRAIEETGLRLASDVGPLRNALDELLVVDPELDKTPFVWLRGEGPEATAASIKEQLAKLELLKKVGADRIDLTVLNPNRVKHLLGLGRRLTPQALSRMEPTRRHQILAVTVGELLVERVDDVLGLFDAAIGAIVNDARRAHERQVTANASVANETVKIFNVVAQVVLDPDVSDSDVRTEILSRVGQRRFGAATDAAAQIEISDSGPLDLVCSRYNRARQYAPYVLAAFDFQGANPDSALLSAIRILKHLNESGGRRVPDDVAVDFATPRWRQHMTTTEGRIDRRSWEMSALIELRGALRGANVWVDHSRRYQDPLNYLVTDHQWEQLRAEAPAATGIQLDPHERLQQMDRDIEEQLDHVDVALQDQSIVRLENDRLVVTPIEALEPDPELDDLRHAIDSLLPEVELADILSEVNSWTGFLDRLTHADNSTHRNKDHAARLMAVIAAYGCNIGLESMARSSDYSPDQLAWTKTWHLRTETARSANDAIVNHQIGQPITQTWGTGTLSSSDGQRFPVTVKSPRASRNRKYFTVKGATIYTWTSDRHAQYGTRVIPTSVREATYVLDAIFDNETDLQIEEHTTDTAGYTDLIFGLFDLCGLRFSPRIKDLADQRLWRLPTTRTNGDAAGLLKHKIRPNRIIARWDDMLRVAASVRHGHIPASVIVSRLQGSARQNELAQAIQEYGRIAKTISALRYLHSKEHRRRIGTQLNKGESLHSLRDEIRYANARQIQRRDSHEQDLEGECLTLITNAVLCWNTIYTQAAIAHLEGASTGHVNRAHIARLSPTGHKHINFLGRYNFTQPTNPPIGQLRSLRT